MTVPAYCPLCGGVTDHRYSHKTRRTASADRRSPTNAKNYTCTGCGVLRALNDDDFAAAGFDVED